MNGKKSHKDEIYGEEIDELMGDGLEMAEADVTDEVDRQLEMLDDMAEEVEEHENLIV